MAVTKQRTELLVGVFLFFGLLLLAVLIFQFGRFSGRSGENYPLHLVVRDASGLKVGAPVRLGGVEIGEVGAEPILSDDFSRLSIELRIKSGRRVPRGSKVTLGTSGLLGDSFVRIEPPAERATEFYAEGQEILAGAGAQSLDDIATGAVETLEEAARVLGEVGESVQAINQIFERFDRELLDPENLENARSILSDLQKSSERIELASRRIDPLLAGVESATADTRGAAKSATDAFAFLQSEVGGITESLGSAGPVIEELDGSLDDLRETLQSLNSLLNQVENGGGLASALLQDGELRRDMQSFLDKLERNGILRYPKEREGSSSRSSTSPSRESKPEKKPLFPLFKN